MQSMIQRGIGGSTADPSYIRPVSTLKIAMPISANRIGGSKNLLREAYNDLDWWLIREHRPAQDLEQS